MEYVLIVEDDVMLREELCGLLRQNGFEVKAPETFDCIPEMVWSASGCPAGVGKWTVHLFEDPGEVGCAGDFCDGKDVPYG